MNIRRDRWSLTPLRSWAKDIATLICASLSEPRVFASEVRGHDRQPSTQTNYEKKNLPFKARSCFVITSRKHSSRVSTRPC